MLPSSIALIALINLLSDGSTITAISAQDVPRPRGTPLSAASLYRPQDNGDWTCLDGERTIRFLQVNDDYCDCADGSDEPGTAACTGGRFHCLNAGFRPLEVPSSRVNDGICDCCDGSDEYSPHTIKCPNTCDHLGRAEAEQRRSEAELYRRGAGKRAEMIERGKQLRGEREAKRVELQRRRDEQEAVRDEKEQLKRNAEALETEALEAYKVQQNELEATAAVSEADHMLEVESGAEAIRREALENFARYDVNKDGFVEVRELQVDINLDRNRNGFVSVEEAKYFLDERERIDENGFTALSWPRLKPILMLAQGLFKPPRPDEAHDELVMEQPLHEQPGEEVHQPTGAMEDPQHGDEEENDGYAVDNENIDEEDLYEDDEDTDGDGDRLGGVGSAQEVTATTPPPDYDPETQRLIELANEARSALAEVQRTINDIDSEIKGIDVQAAKDYGPNEEYASMDGECYAFEDRQYVYTLCPFDRASQKDRSGGSETTLGRWDQWLGGDGEQKYARQKYSHGASCWNGPQRSVVVQLRCALEHRVVAVSEPNRCEYFFDFETPTACDAARLGEEHPEERRHDEL